MLVSPGQGRKNPDYTFSDETRLGQAKRLKPLMLKEQVPPLIAPELRPLIERAHTVLAQLEAWLPPTPTATDWSARAYRWRKRGARGWLDAVARIAPMHLHDLQHIDRQKGIIERNTLAFLNRKPANNVLMTGARGTGKSSLVRAMLDAYGDRGLRLIEVDKADMGDLGEIIDQIGRAHV